MEELDLSQLFEIFWNRKLQILIIILIFIILGVTYTICFVTPKYTSSTTLVLATEQSTDTSGASITANDITLNAKLLSTYSELATSTKVARQVISNLGIDMSENSLKHSISVKAVSDAEMISISVVNEEPEMAAKIANEVATAFIEQVKEYYGKNNVHVVDVAEVNENPSNINHTKDVIIFTFIGIVVAVGYALIANMLDTTVKTVEDIEKQCSVSVLVSIPFENFGEKKGGKK